MKSKTLYIFITILILVSVFVWQNNQQEQVISSTNSELIPVKEALLVLQKEKDFKQFSKEEKLVKIYQVLEQLPKKYKKLKHQYQVALSTLPDITFYGRVLDQYNQPVVNASIWYEGSNIYLAAGGGRGLVHTDTEGYFEIDTEGATLVLGGIGHPDIDGVTYVLPKKSTGRDARFDSFDDPNGIYLNWKNYIKKENPYIVHAWRLGEYKGAISGNLHSHYDSDGKYYTLSLKPRVYDKQKRVHSKQKKVGKNDGHIYVSCTRRHMESNRDYGDWTAHITPVNGGIQETEDLYTNIAPETGYQPSLDITMSKGSQEYKHELNKRYYFKSNNGKEYGSLHIKFLPFWTVEKDVCKIDITYTINPTGSRNLELKRSNTSRPQLPTTQKLASNQA